MPYSFGDSDQSGLVQRMRASDGLSTSTSGVSYRADGVVAQPTSQPAEADAAQASEDKPFRIDECREVVKAEFGDILWSMRDGGARNNVHLNMACTNPHECTPLQADPSCRGVCKVAVGSARGIFGKGRRWHHVR